MKTASLADVIFAAIDVYHAHHPELMLSEILEGLAEVHQDVTKNWDEQIYHCAH